MAAVFRGSSIVTTDLDFAIAYRRENLTKLARALAPLHPRPMRLAPGANWVWDELCIRPPWSIFLTDAGRVDLVVSLPGVDSFDGLYARSTIETFDGAELRVAGLDDLIAMKQVTDRDKDRVHLQILLAIKKLQSEVVD